MISYGVTIDDVADEDPWLAVHLPDILDLFVTEVKNSQWKIFVEDCLGDTAEQLWAISDSKTVISGQKLRELASGVYQIIDGEFTGCHSEEQDAWIVIRAVDSSWYDVYSRDEYVVERIRQRYKVVSDIPEEHFKGYY
jgi:hypothetical protein